MCLHEIAAAARRLTESRVRTPKAWKSRTLALCAITMAAVAGLGQATPAQAVTPGWQGVATYNVPTGLVSLQYGYNCPTIYPTAHNGSFAMNSVGQTSQVSLTFNGTRIDIPSFSEWAWHFYWPNGAPAGVSIQFDVYCEKH
jgi:hypothetical protein